MIITNNEKEEWLLKLNEMKIDEEGERKIVQMRNVGVVSRRAPAAVCRAPRLARAPSAGPRGEGTSPGTASRSETRSR